MVDFDSVQQEDCMYALSMEVLDELRDHIQDLYLRMFQRCAELPDGMPNVILPALTLAWIEATSSIFGSASYESAVTVLAGISPEDKEARKLMRQSINDLLRRTRWSQRRKKS